MTDISNFATKTGSDIVTGLTATAAEFQSLLVQGQITYGLIKYTFSGSPDLSMVLQGHNLNVTNFANAGNNGSGMYIQSFSNVDKTITVKMVERINNSEDETGASASATVTTAGAGIKEMSVAYNAQGFSVGNKVSADNLNWVITQQQALIDDASGRSAHIYAGASSISSSTFADLDGAGIPFAEDRTASDVSWSSGGNDYVYESVGVDLTLNLKGSTKTLHIVTGETTNGATGPTELLLKSDGSTIVDIDATPFTAQTQSTSLFSYASLSGTLAGGSTDFEVLGERVTGRAATKLRAYAIELSPLDGSGNSLVQEFTTSLTQTIVGGSDADITGASATGTFQSGNKALILFGNSQRTNAGNATTNRTRIYKLLRDGSEVHAWDAISPISILNLQGGYDELARVEDVTGAHTFKMQAAKNGGTDQIMADSGNGYFGMIEIPAENALSVVELADTQYSYTSYTEVATTPLVSCTGAPVLLTLSGHFYGIENGATDCIQFIKFQIDGVDVDSAYSIRHASSNNSRYGTIMILVDSVTAGDHTFSVEAYKSQAIGFRFYDTQFSAIELPIADPAAGNAPAFTIIDTTGKKVDIQYNGTIAPSVDSTVTLQVTRDGTATGNPFEIQVKSGNVYGLSFRTIAEAPTIGTSPDYKLQGKVSTGTASLSSGDFTGQEVGGS